mgnify:CR=1 FL=1
MVKQGGPNQLFLYKGDVLGYSTVLVTCPSNQHISKSYVFHRPTLSGDLRVVILDELDYYQIVLLML